MEAGHRSHQKPFECRHAGPLAGAQPFKMLSADREEGIVCSFRGTARLVPASRRVSSTSFAAAKRGVNASPSTDDGSELFRRLWKGTIRALLQASPSSAARLGKGSADAASRRPRTSSAGLPGTARTKTSPGDERSAAACHQPHHRVLMRSVVR